MQRLATGAVAATPPAGGADAATRQRPQAKDDPKFTALTTDIRGKQKTMAAHPPAQGEADKAQGAAVPPQDDKEAQGKAVNADKMNAAKPGQFDKAAFISKVNTAIAAQAPKNLNEAMDPGSKGDPGTAMHDELKPSKQTAAGAIETTTNAPPDTSGVKEKKVVPLNPPPGVATPGAPDPDKAVPDKAPPSATDFSAGPQQVNAQLGDIPESTLKNSNEPEFTQALADKKAVETHAATAPGQVRDAEAKTLDAAKADAGAQGQQAVTAMAQHHNQAQKNVGTGQQTTKDDHQTKQQQVTSKLQTVFDATKKEVQDILSGLDQKVDHTFGTEEKKAHDAFTADAKKRMDAYKDKRYSGFTGKLRWAKDQFAGLPEEANQIFATARAGYVTQMQQVISQVADVIGTELNRAKQRIAEGRTQMQTAIKQLPADEQALGRQAAQKFSGQFDELTQSVDDKGNDLVNTLASKYNDALKAVDSQIDAEKEKNKGLVAKAVDAVKGVVDTILKLKDMLLGVLAKAASAVMAIIKDPIGFLGHLVNAVGAGLKNFLANIGDHLKKGLIGWLTGAMAGAGLQLPDKFDLRGILGMIASLLGLTWASIRGKIVSRGVPEQAMTTVEQSVPVAQKLQKEGVGGVTEEIKEQVGDLKTNLFGKITEYLLPTVLIAGITWIISLLNPASAFVKACKMIIDIVTFIIDRGAQIIEFVNSVLDAVIAIAGGAGGGVPALVEGALAKSVPVLIGALAAILGIGGVADKVKSFFHALAKPVTKAVNWVVDKIVAFGKKIWAKLKGVVKGKGKDGKESKRGGKDATDKERILADAMDASDAALKPYNGRIVPQHTIDTTLGQVQSTYPGVTLTASPHGSKWRVTGKINPSQSRDSGAGVLDPKKLREIIQAQQRCNNPIATARKLLEPKGRVQRKASDKVESLRARLDPLEKENEDRKTDLEQLRKGESVELAPGELIQAFHHLRERAEQLGTLVDDALTTSTEKVERVRQEHTQITALLTKAKSAVGDKKIKDLVLDDPAYAGLKTTIDEKIAILDAFLAGPGRLPDDLTSLSDQQLTTLLGQLRAKTTEVANPLHSDVNRAEREARPEQALREPTQAIDSICTNTTKGGRPGADVGDGSSEAALEKETKEGKPYKSPQGHHIKVADSITGLNSAIAALRRVLAMNPEPATRTKVEQTITQATARRAGLQGGLDRWQARVANYPDVWNSDGSSKVTPGWP